MEERCRGLNLGCGSVFHPKRFAGLLILLLAAVAAGPVAAQQAGGGQAAGTGQQPGGGQQSGAPQGTESNGKPKIVLTRLDAPSDDPVAAQIAATVSQSVALMLKLTGSFSVVSADFLDPIASYGRSVLYYQQAGARVGIFGNVAAGSSGSYTITVRYWSADAPNAPPKSFTKVITNVFGAFDAADELAVTVASEAAGRNLSVGTVVVENTGQLPNYSIYADGQLVARNRNTVKVLTGKRTVIVAVPGPLGDQPVESFDVDVAAGKIATVSLNEAAAAGKTTAEAIGTGASGAAGATAKPSSGGPVGSLRVTTTPAGATVIFDGKEIGTTPLERATVPAGTHSLQIKHKYFLTVDRSVNVIPDGTAVVEAKLNVNPKDPEITKRELNPLGTAGRSLLWSGMQTLGFFAVATAITGTTPATTSFWSSVPSNGDYVATTAADVTANVLLLRIGNRIAGNSTLTKIGDAAAILGSAFFDLNFSPQILGNTSAGLTIGNGVFSSIGIIGVLGSVAFDALSSPFAAIHSNNQLLDYVAIHGELPPIEKLTPHRFLAETGGDSILRLGYRYPLIPDRLAVEATAGLGASSLSPFTASLASDTRLSWNPFGSSTGDTRPEVHLGLRANTDFSGASVALEGGTGVDWLGKRFDVYTRGGAAYDFVGRHWDEYFTLGTRLF